MHALKIGAAMPGARVLERQRAIHVLPSRRNPQRIVAIVHIRIQRVVDLVLDIDIHAADQINDLLKGRKVHTHVIVNRLAQVVLNRLLGQTRGRRRAIGSSRHTHTPC